MLSDGAMRDIRAFQDETGWFHNGHTVFYPMAEELIAHGFSESDAVDFLRDAYGVVADEFGLRISDPEGTTP